MEIHIDKNSGYCFGVEYAIQMAEDALQEAEVVYCLGDIVHNDREVERLHAKGLRIINREELKNLRDCKVLIRAHGEPPETYEIALRNNIELIDASCPVVLKLQHRVKTAYDKSMQENGQVVIYGKPGHAEVIGLIGQTRQNAIVVSGIEDLDEKVDFTKPITLFSQTTKPTSGFYALKAAIEERLQKNGLSPDEYFRANDSICRQVSNREPQLREFARRHDVILFVAGKKSSNGRSLFEVCRSENPRSYFIEDESEIQAGWLAGAQKVGICGATSTPMWLMQRVARHLESMEAAYETDA
ncbi:MAG: 4-hydroxy-3-methylbut-2-enyl diphosphate reductase [Thermonema sp.]|uniref:4-hydroxy-3-methylbut-2-enyl diphosphate reductase n=1 Tax=Thermonema sp. TaxID=2231181 RepID=UPI0021DD9AE2|nr:4-hydroxy-3-methylbut-2-enyl diphosphate reductase [Thermonema sp.]GIV38819.1 MAG: 4-hydroxy-3-methylbut-2-enyl diphosphate reductase [Thermonema sp.]